MKESEAATAVVRERECTHRAEGGRGGYYPARLYVEGLQRMRGDDAVRMAREVGQFFWEDAPLLGVWPCEACAREVGL
jgi:hypothetical protein